MTTLIVSPLPIAAIAASRGSGVANLNTVDPREVWVDSEAGTVSFTVDLGGPREVDTVWLGFVSPPRADATWSITGGINSGAEATLLVNDTLRVPDVAGRFAQSTSALWYGAAVVMRQLVVTVRQPAGMPLTIGRLIVGRAFAPELGKEWGSGRQPIDSGTATTLPTGGYAAVEGAKRRYFGWTFGDLGGDDVDELEAIALDHGETLPVLVVDDPRRTRGLRSRILYGRFDRWKQFDRRNSAQTKWELGIEEFLWLPANRATPDGGQMINAAYDWSVASGEPIGLLYRRKRADGTVRPLTGEVFVLTIYDASRAPAASIEATIVQDSEGDYARMVFPAGTSERLVNYRMLAWELSQLLPGGDRTPLYGGSFSVTPTASSTAGTPPTVGDASYQMIIDREEA